MRSLPFRRLRTAALALAWLASAAAVRAHDDHETPKVPDAEAHKPSAIPDRIILTWNGDPGRSQAVTWRTDATVRRAVAQIATADAGPKFVESAKTIEADTTPLTTDLGDALYHSAAFEGLEPSTLYAYRVGDGTNWSAWAHFRTADDRPAPFAFIYFGDAQNDIKSLWSRVVRGAYSDAPKARFIIHAGDLINRAGSDADWGEWHGAAGWVNAMVPSVPVPGNHEYEKPKQEQPATEPNDAKRTVSRHWRPQFTLPENGPEGLEETAYYLDYQGVRIVGLNSNEEQERQAEWLDRVLDENPGRWAVVTFHHPIFSAAKERDNPALRRLWKPIFDRHRVDLVLQGHDHTYARGQGRSKNVATGAANRDAESGTVYVVSVSGPKMYNLGREDWMRRAAEDTQLYQIVRIDGDTLRYEARTATGALYDAFELQKNSEGRNTLIERKPDTPERLRPRMAPEAGGGPTADDKAGR